MPQTYSQSKDCTAEATSNARVEQQVGQTCAVLSSVDMGLHNTKLHSLNTPHAPWFRSVRGKKTAQGDPRQHCAAALRGQRSPPQPSCTGVGWRGGGVGGGAAGGGRGHGGGSWPGPINCCTHRLAAGRWVRLPCAPLAPSQASSLRCPILVQYRRSQNY